MKRWRNGKTRYYIHGDLQEKSIDTYYCGVCDAFVDEEHFYDKFHREYNKSSYTSGLRRIKKANKASRDKLYRLNDSFNLFSELTTPKVGHFYRWLKKQKDRDDPIGDVSREAISDKTFPLHTSSYKKIKSYLYSRNACDEAIAALAESFDEFKHRDRSSVSLKLRFEILRQDNYRCQICGASSKDSKLEVDHKIPLAQGGTNDKSNLWTLCFKCNRGKGTSKL